MSAASARRRVRWGQNFLVDRSVARAIVDWAAVDGRRVLEIGPGRGALTGELAGRAERLWLVEIDRRLAADLCARYRRRPEIRVIRADVLDLELDAFLDPPVLAIGNLPYESGTAIVSQLLQRPGLFDEMIFMLQREVCERLTAESGSSNYGMLSIHAQLRADVELGRRVSPSCFRPRPKVESRLVRLRPLARPRFPIGDESVFAELLRRAFSARRKMIRNGIGEWLERCWGSGAADDLLATAGIDGSQRPATVTLASYAALSAALSARKKRDA